MTTAASRCGIYEMHRNQFNLGGSKSSTNKLILFDTNKLSGVRCLLSKM